MDTQYVHPGLSRLRNLFWNLAVVPVVWYVAYVRPFEEFGGPLEISREEMLCLIPGEVIAIDSRQPEELGRARFA